MPILRRLSILGALASASLWAGATDARADFFYQTTPTAPIANGTGSSVSFANTQATETGNSASDVTLQNVTFTPGPSPGTLSGSTSFSTLIVPFPANTPTTTYGVSGTFTATYSAGVYSVTYTPSVTLSGATDLYSLTNVHYVAATGTTGAIVGTISAVPEPGSLALAGCGLLGLAGYGLRRRNASA